MEFADNLTPEDMAGWNNAIIAETGAVDNTTGEKKKSTATISNLLGIAVGCIGMSHDDFRKCTFGEFESICKAWHEMTEGQNRDAWERARTVAAKRYSHTSKRKYSLVSYCRCRGIRKKAIPGVRHQSSPPRNSEKDSRKSHID